MLYANINTNKFNLYVLTSYILLQVIKAQDQGSPMNSAISNLNICVTDFNDNAPVFISPPHNITIRIPEVNITLMFLNLLITD